MASNNDSKCYFVQLQIDSFLDGELGPVQREEFQSHVHQCQTCAQELRFAQTLHDYVLDMPQVDCDERVLEPIRRLGGGHWQSETGAPSIWQRISDWFDSVPVFPRYAVAMLLLGMLIMPVVNRILLPPADAPLVAEQSPGTETPEYTPEEIQQALMDLNLAIKYLNGMGQRTEAMIGGRFLLNPLQESLNASFEAVRSRDGGSLDDDPI